MSVEIKPNKILYNFLKSIVRLIVKTRTKIVVEKNDTEMMEGPYLILSNHVNNWDPIFINLIVKEPICFIAGDSLFRIPVLKNILNYLGAIPKTKFKNDTRTIRGMMKAKKHNRVIGIFPEGNRNWDGITEPITFATGKLAKRLDIPVVIGTIKGGHLSQPRWGHGNRKGTIYISLSKEFDSGEFKDDTPSTVHKKLTDAFTYDEMHWQKENREKYKRKNLAHYLERLLLVCPHCQVPGKLHSHDDLLECSHCSYTVRYTEYGTFEQSKHNLVFSTTAEWNKWQLDFIRKSLADEQMLENWKAIMLDHVKFYRSTEGSALSLVSAGKLSSDLEPNGKLLFHADNGEEFSFPLVDLEGLNIHLHHMLDFFIGDKMYRFVFYQPRTSAYKWIKTIQTKLQLEQSKEGIS